jgi:HPt (histidine-containing phosphotransfer) domain-containing protein
VTDFEENYRRLRGRFLDRSREDLEVIRRERDPSRLRPVVHRLAGAAGTFGFQELSTIAGEVDDELVEGRAPAPEAIDRLTAEIERAVAAG